MASGPSDPDHWKNDQIHSITDLFKYMEPNECCRALVGAWSYVHIQFVSSQTWTINHGLKTDDLVLFGFNAEILGSDMLDWSYVNVIDHNTIQVIWPEPRTGRVVVVSTGTRPNPNLELFLQFLDAYPTFYTEYTYDAEDYLITKVHWDAPTKTVKLFTITYIYNDGYLISKVIRHEINSQFLTLTYTYTPGGDLANVSRALTM